jgi:predicted GNAT family N-acyltransferase
MLRQSQGLSQGSRRPARFSDARALPEPMSVPNRTVRHLAKRLQGTCIRVRRARALELRQQVYAHEWPHVPVDIVVDDLDSRAHHLVALDTSQQVIAALRMVGPDQRPFDLDPFVVLSDFIPSGRVPAEIGRFCIRPDQRQIRKDVVLPMGMLKLSYDFARKQGFTDLVIVTWPRLRNFFRLGFFEPVGISLEHPTWGRGTVMRLDLVNIETHYSDSPLALARLLLTTELPNVRV